MYMHTYEAILFNNSMKAGEKPHTSSTIKASSHPRDLQTPREFEQHARALTPKCAKNKNLNLESTYTLVKIRGVSALSRGPHPAGLYGFACVHIAKNLYV